MPPDPEQRRSGLNGLVVTLLVLLILSYMGFAGLRGERGYFRLLETQAEEAGLRDELAALRENRAALANKTDRLSTGTLDLELLDEQARKVLALGRNDELLLPPLAPRP